MKYLDNAGTVYLVSKVKELNNTKANASDIPTKVSELDNDSNFLTTETDPTVPSYVKAITQANITSWNNKLDSFTETDPTVPSWAKASSKPSYTASEVGAIATTAKGAANGVASLGADGKIPSSQLPSYVDDVLEYANKASFPATGEAGKIYIDLATNIQYRWGGTVYVAISSSLALGETSSTAYAGDKGKAVTDKVATIEANYLKTTDMVAITTAEIDAMFS